MTPAARPPIAPSTLAALPLVAVGLAADALLTPEVAEAVPEAAAVLDADIVGTSVALSVPQVLHASEPGFCCRQFWNSWLQI